MTNDIKFSEEDEAKRQALEKRLRDNIFALGDLDAAILRLQERKAGVSKEHLLLDNDIREFNMAINEKHAPKQEPVLSVEE
tara:strand:+ start:619 stop:861 length:243 start_codon:yes stop_codon:yes gene_type:complete